MFDDLDSERTLRVKPLPPRPHPRPISSNKAPYLASSYVPASADTISGRDVVAKTITITIRILIIAAGIAALGFAGWQVFSMY